MALIICAGSLVVFWLSWIYKSEKTKAEKPPANLQTQVTSPGYVAGGRIARKPNTELPTLDIDIPFESFKNQEIAQKGLLLLNRKASQKEWIKFAEETGYHLAVFLEESEFGPYTAILTSERIPLLISKAGTPEVDLNLHPGTDILAFSQAIGKQSKVLENFVLNRNSIPSIMVERFTVDEDGPQYLGRQLTLKNP